MNDVENGVYTENQYDSVVIQCHIIHLFVDFFHLIKFSITRYNIRRYDMRVNETTLHRRHHL